MECSATRFAGDRPAPWEAPLDGEVQGPVQGLEPEALIVLLCDGNETKSDKVLSALIDLNAS